MEDSEAGLVDRNSGRKTDKRQWARDEDKLLIALVKTHGPGKWNRIAGHIRGRTALSCRSRWVNHLNPLVDKTPFSEEENKRLLELHREHGNKWSTFVSFFPGRTDSQLKNQYHVLVGSRVSEASRPSSRRGRPRSCPDPRYIEPYRSMHLSTPAVGSQTSYGPAQGENVSGSAPRSNSLPGKTQMLFFNGGSSSNPGGEGTQFMASVSDLSRNGCHSSGSMKSATKSVATS